MPTAIEVAQYIVKQFQEQEDLITNLKLQKLLYYVQGWHLGLTGQRAFEGEFKAWVHGPVNTAVYHEFRDYRWNPITRDMPDVSLPDQLKAHVDAVLQVYGGDTGWSLEQRTHTELPWLEARGDLAPDEECRVTIKESTMERFFAEQARDDEEDTEARA